MRPQNEDALGWGRIGAPLEDNLEDAGQGLVFAVADGLGAYGGGDVASQMAVKVLLDHARGHPPGADLRPAKLLRTAFESANRGIFDAALAGEGSGKMQTTMSALVLSPGEAHLGHVGDCRGYRLRGGDVEILTTDHTQVMEMLRMRIISPEQAAEHPARHALTRSLGNDLLTRTDVRKEVLQDGDTFILCSDGMWGKLEVAEIRDALSTDDLQAACDQLAELAWDRGGEDNITGMMVRVLSAGQAPERPAGWRRFFS
ncbi:MAG: protein phosphatase 2C domain-containing protein [Candidatus Dormibacteraeota bacterium]|nr:protein phosphatase 2C domain-containing protein [Candidatus Dormibacteraeota bacterium]